MLAPHPSAWNATNDTEQFCAKTPSVRHASAYIHWLGLAVSRSSLVVVILRRVGAPHRGQLEQLLERVVL